MTFFFVIVVDARIDGADFFLQHFRIKKTQPPPNRRLDRPLRVPLDERPPRRQHRRQLDRDRWLLVGRVRNKETKEKNVLFFFFFFFAPHLLLCFAHHCFDSSPSASFFTDAADAASSTTTTAPRRARTVRLCCRFSFYVFFLFVYFGSDSGSDGGGSSTYTARLQCRHRDHKRRGGALLSARFFVLVDHLERPRARSRAPSVFRARVLAHPPCRRRQQQGRRPPRACMLLCRG